MFLVTVKIPKRVDHDPFNKQTGPCPITGKECSDVTGQHHTALVQTKSDVEIIRQFWGNITRIEEV